MFAALAKAIQQCSDPTFRRVLLRAVGLSFVVFVLLWIVAGALLAWGGGWLLDWMDPEGFWRDALEVGVSIAEEFPNSRIAQEVRERLNILRERAGLAADVEVTSADPPKTDD